MRLNFRITIFCVALLSIFLSDGFSEKAVLRTLSATVKMVDVPSSKVFVDFTHPATGELHELELQVNQDTGYKGVQSIDELTPQSAVQVDYEKTETGLFVKRLVLVQLAGTHPDLVGFTPMSLLGDKEG